VPHLFHQQATVLLVGSNKMLKVKKVSNTTVSMDFADCESDGGKYALTCNTHGYIIQDSNKNRLWKNALDVSDWCEACAGNDERFSA
jgi:hypothetical protein